MSTDLKQDLIRAKSYFTSHTSSHTPNTSSKEEATVRALGPRLQGTRQATTNIKHRIYDEDSKASECVQRLEVLQKKHAMDKERLEEIKRDEKEGKNLMVELNKELKLERNSVYYSVIVYIIFLSY
jgi:hypothetical protein